MLDYSFYDFSRVRSEYVAQKESKVMSMNWVFVDPIALLTRPLENLQKLAEQANIPCTDQ